MLRSTMFTADLAMAKFRYVLTSRADAVHMLVSISLRSLNSRAAYTQQGSPELLKNLGLLPRLVQRIDLQSHSYENEVNVRLDALKWHKHKQTRNQSAL